MNTKDILLKLKTSRDVDSRYNEILYSKYDLTKKIDDFIKWKRWINVKEDYSDREICDFIEKMAIWYEFRYTNNYLFNTFSYDKDPSGLNEIKNSIGYQNLLSILNEKEINNLESIIDLIDYKDVFDIKTFLNTLSSSEINLLERPEFSNTFSSFRLRDFGILYLNLTRRGKIADIEKSKYIYSDNKTNLSEKLEEYIGKSIKEIIPILEKYNLNDEIEDIRNRCLKYDTEVMFKERLLDSVLYRIIERGGYFYGILRGYLFAKEFKRNLEIPVTYIDNTAYYNRSIFRKIINDYLKNGGNLDLICCLNYFGESRKVYEVSLKHLYNQDIIMYTPEEKELQRRIISMLNNKVIEHSNELELEKEKLKRDEIYEKRLQRRLEKSRNR